MGEEAFRSNYHLLQAPNSASPRLRKAIIENSEKDLVLGKTELMLIALNGKCKICRFGADRLGKHKSVLRNWSTT
jgi:hypothetical protein